MEAATTTRNSEDGALFSPQPQMIEVYPSGDFVDLLNPQPETIHLADITHHLSMCCRYAGGVKEFYSVAEHAALVHDLIPYIVPPDRFPILCVDLQRAALLHDATEAYAGDATAPLKYAMRQVEVPSELGGSRRVSLEHSTYDAIEKRLERVIAERFNVDQELFSDQRLKHADLWAMKIEATKLTKTKGSNWRWPGELPHGGAVPDRCEFVGGMRPLYAKARFHGRACRHTWPKGTL